MLDPELEKVILGYIEEVNPDIFVIELMLSKGKKSVLKIVLDTDEGIKLEECSRISRKVGWHIEENALWNFPYTLEVTSPGIGNPLKLKRQYIKNVGRQLKVVMNDGQVKKGVLEKVEEESIALKPVVSKKTKAKKTVNNDSNAIMNINFNEIKEAKVQVSFN